jgi:hypothetical protein
MNRLLAQIVDAHGGINRWKGYEKVEATIVNGGGFFANCRVRVYCGTIIAKSCRL